MTTAQLPFLIVYGQWLWIAPAIAVVIFAIWILGRRRQRIAKTRTEEFLYELGATTPVGNFASGQRVVLEGVIRGDDKVDLVGALSNPHADPVPPTVPYVDAGKELILDGENTWGLQGPIEILWARDVAKKKNQLFMRVHLGDRVRVQGTLQMTPNEANYREAAAQWGLKGTQKQPLRLVSCDAPRPGVGWRGVLTSAVLSLALLALGFKLIGGSAMVDAANDNKFTLEGGEVSYPVSYQIAAASPFHRDKALSRLSYAIKHQEDLGSPGTRALVELALMNRDCLGAARVALKRNQWNLAKKVLLSCQLSEETAHLSHIIYLMRGDFAEASDSLKDMPVSNSDEDSLRSADFYDLLGWRQAVEVHLLAGNYLAAATQLEQAAKHAPTATNRTRELRCLAAALRARTGQSGEQEALAADEHLCQILRADLLQPPHRTIALGRISDEPRPLLLALLTAEDGAPPRDEMTLMLIYLRLGPTAVSYMLDNAYRDTATPDQGLLANAHRGLVKSQRAALLRSRLALERAYFELDVGYLEAAESLAQAAHADLLVGLQAINKAVPTNLDPSEQEAHYDQVYSHREGLYLSNLILGKIAQQQGESESAGQHIEAAKRLGKDLHIRKFPDILISGETQFQDRLSNGGRLTPDSVRASNLRAISMVNAQSIFESIFELRREIDYLDAPEWKVELDQAINNWHTALLDRDRSLMLTVLDQI